MNSKINVTLIIITGLLALTTVVASIYGIQNKKETQSIYASYNQPLLDAVESAVSICQDAFNSVRASEEEKESLEYYITNINEAKSPVLKAYIASSMITYTGNHVNIMYADYNAGERGIVNVNYKEILENITAVRTRLSSARQYDNRTAPVQEQ